MLVRLCVTSKTNKQHSPRIFLYVSINVSDSHSSIRYGKLKFKQFECWHHNWLSHFHIICFPNWAVWPTLHTGIVCVAWKSTLSLIWCDILFEQTYFKLLCGFRNLTLPFPVSNLFAFGIFLFLLEMAFRFSKVIKFQSIGRCGLFDIQVFNANMSVRFWSHFLSSYFWYWYGVVRKKTTNDIP